MEPIIYGYLQTVQVLVFEHSRHRDVTRSQSKQYCLSSDGVKPIEQLVHIVPGLVFSQSKQYFVKIEHLWQVNDLSTK